MVSLTAIVWLAIAAWALVAIFAWSAVTLAAKLDERFPAPKVRKPRQRKGAAKGEFNETFP